MCVALVNLMRQLDWLRDAQIVGKTLCPGASVKVLLDEISI